MDHILTILLNSVG